MKNTFFSLFILSSLCWGSSSGAEPAPLKTPECISDQPAAEIPSCVEGRLLHVKSPDWSEQIIYFLMIDRFNDGNIANNDFGHGLHDPSRNSHYSGGDIQGVTDKVDYIKNLGVTAVWITPPNANQWWDPITKYTGYHGYWPISFDRIDQRYGSLDEYKDLSHALHSNGMYLIQDVIVNHIAHYYNYDGGYNINDNTENFRLNTGVIPSTPPSPPFDKYNLLDPEHAKAKIFHWTPGISDYSEVEQALTYQLDLVNDLNTSNKVVRDALKKAHAFWIRDIGVDGFRLDAIKHVEHDFWNDFIHSEDGIENTALKTGRGDFFTFGESFDFSDPMHTNGEEKIISYYGSDEKPEIKSLINFPLYIEMRRVFNGASPTRHLTFRLNAQMKLYKDPYLVPNFIDNHDVERFISSGNTKALQQAFTLLMTIPGVPIIYQGDEQGFSQTRKTMFAGGYQSETGSFDQKSKMYKFIQSLTHIRLNNKIFTKGSLETLLDNPHGAGVIAYKRAYKGKVAFVIMNTSETNSTLLNQMETGLSQGQHLVSLLDTDDHRQIRVGHKGRITLELDPREILILMEGENQTERANSDKNKPTHTITLDQNIEGQSFTEDILLTGKVSKPNSQLHLVIDGDLDNAGKFMADDKGLWQTILPISGTRKINHMVEIYAPSLKTASVSQRYVSNMSPSKSNIPLIQMTLNDPINDHKGPTGKYRFPTSPDTPTHTMDINSVDILTQGANLELSITVGEISDIWGFIDNFDHASFNIFFDLPGKKGLRVLPRIQANAPDGFSWNMAHSFFGLDNSLYDTQGADAKNTGHKQSVEPFYILDKENKTFKISYEGKHFGLDDWRGVKIYITTWDRDGYGLYLGISEETSVSKFSGASPGDPRILDDMLIEIPQKPTGKP